MLSSGVLIEKAWHTHTANANDSETHISAHILRLESQVSICVYSYNYSLCNQANDSHAASQERKNRQGEQAILMHKSGALKKKIQI